MLFLILRKPHVGHLEIWELTPKELEAASGATSHLRRQVKKYLDGILEDRHLLSASGSSTINSVDDVGRTPK